MTDSRQPIRSTEETGANAPANPRRDDLVDMHTRPTPVHRPSDLTTHAVAINPAELPPIDVTAERVGRYAVRAPLAKGGLGEVFVADDEELPREVALKRIQQRWAGDPASKRRFLLEAEITARLEHPGVVPVHGLVRDAAGQLCYAMRLIRGESFAQAIRSYHQTTAQTGTTGERRLAFRQLLQRYLAVCQTMACAHSKGIIHRDLKPANVMLGLFGETLVVDWGLAKEVGSPRPEVSSQKSEISETDQGNGRPEHIGSEEPTLRPSHDSASPDSATVAGQALGTPSYMSPEQAAGQWETIGAATDIYGLGAILYELLTGRSPVRANDPLEALDKVQRGDFPPPRRLQPAIPRSLEAVCLTAMALKPEDRYATAQSLAEDVEHWLADEPVTAYREPWAARAGRWLRRHRTWAASAVAAIALTALFLALLTGVVANKNADLAAAYAGEREARSREEAAKNDALEQKKRAKDNFDKAKKAVDDYLNTVTDEGELRENPKLAPLREKLLKQAVQFYNELAAQSGDQLDVLEAQMWAYRRLGMLWLELGDNVQARDNLMREIQLLRRLLPVMENKAYYQSMISGALDHQSRAEVGLGQLEAAERHLQEACELEEELLRADRGNRQNRDFLAKHYGGLGALRTDYLRRLPEAEAAFRKAIELEERLMAEHPDDPGYLQELASTSGNLGVALFGMARLAEAEAARRRCVDLDEKLVAAHPGNREYRRHLAWALANLGTQLSSPSRAAEAEAPFRRAIALCEQLALDYPTVPRYRYELAAKHGHWADALILLSRPAEAEAESRRALELWQQLTKTWPNVPDYIFHEAYAHLQLAEFLRLHGRPTDAELELHAATPALKGLIAKFPQVPGYSAGLLKANVHLGETLRALGRWAEAEAAFQEALTAAQKLRADFPAVADYGNEAAMILWSLASVQSAQPDRQSECLATYQKCESVLVSLVADFPAEPRHRRFLTRIQQGYAGVLKDQGKLAEADAAYLRAQSLLDTLAKEDPSSPENDVDLGALNCNLAGLRFAQNRLEAALPLFDRAVELLDKACARKPPQPQAEQFLSNALSGRAITLVNLGRYGDSLPDWNRAESLGSAAQQLYCRLQKCVALARAGEHAQAFAAVNVEVQQNSPNGVTCNDLARACALAAAKTQDPDQREKYAARAVELLRLAAEKGNKDKKFLTGEPDLDSLRGREDFRRLIEELKFAP